MRKYEDLSISDALLKVIDRLSESKKTNSDNIKELIAQGRQQTDNITKLVNLLCQNDVDVSNNIKKGNKNIFLKVRSK
jgi:hypothetical protein